MLYSGKPCQRGKVRLLKGVHLVVPQSKLPVNSAIVLSAVRDGRVTFIIPWEESTVIGTTDTDFTGDGLAASDRRRCSILLETANLFPDVKLNTSDVLSTWTGLRPLVADDSDNPYNTSRSTRFSLRAVSSRWQVENSPPTKWRRSVSTLLHGTWGKGKRRLERASMPHCPERKGLRLKRTDLRPSHAQWKSSVSKRRPRPGCGALWSPLGKYPD